MFLLRELVLCFECSMLPQCVHNVFLTNSHGSCSNVIGWLNSWLHVSQVGIYLYCYVVCLFKVEGYLSTGSHFLLWFTLQWKYLCFIIIFFCFTFTMTVESKSEQWQTRGKVIKNMCRDSENEYRQKLLSSFITRVTIISP